MRKGQGAPGGLEVGERGTAGEHLYCGSRGRSRGDGDAGSALAILQMAVPLGPRAVPSHRVLALG